VVGRALPLSIAVVAFVDWSPAAVLPTGALAADWTVVYTG